MKMKRPFNWCQRLIVKLNSLSVQKGRSFGQVGKNQTKFSCEEVIDKHHLMLYLEVSCLKSKILSFGRRARSALRHILQVKEAKMPTRLGSHQTMYMTKGQ